MWSTSNLEETKSLFLEPLSERVLELKEEYIRRLALAEQELDMELGDGEDDVPGAPGMLPPLKAKSGVVNFDIDMDSEDEGDDDLLPVPGQRKESALELNQSIMRLELMDELLERIQELTNESNDDDDSGEEDTEWAAAK